MAIIRYFITSILLFNALNNNPVDKNIFSSPVRIPLALSGNFGELRIDHFHTGIDIKTQGVAGKEVVAAASGYIYRIGVSPGGFGKVIYIRHPSGYLTAYGHLDRFRPDIEEYVKNLQYEKKSFLVNLFPVKDKFPVTQGDMIGFSGNSGSSAGPHLHFELRKSDTENPVNPLLFDFGASDDIKPAFERLFIYPVSENTLINNKNSIKKIAVSGSQGNYYISPENDLKISGTAGFGIKSYDLLNGSYNKCAVYSIELKIDSITRFRYVMDEFSYSETRFINSHIDYETYLKENTFIERTFILPNDRLSLYHDAVDRGLFNFNDDKTHFIQIIATDIHNNKSCLNFKVTSYIPEFAPEKKVVEDGLVIMPFNRTNRFRAENITITIPAGALYDTLAFRYKKDTGTPQMLSDVHYIHDKYTPVHKAYTISVKPSVIPAGKESKMMIIQMSDDFKKNALNSTMTDGYVTAESLSFGMFYVGIDTVPPVISANGLISGADLSEKNEIRIRITDDLSGIKGYEPLVDGKWALFEFDQKNNVLIYKFDPKRISKGNTHNLSLKVNDNKDNQSVYSCEFTW